MTGSLFQPDRKVDKVLDMLKDQLNIVIPLSLVIVSLFLGTAVSYNAVAQPHNANNSLLLPSVPTGCKLQHEGLPDPTCTPGEVNPAVTQNNIQSTICVPGWTKTIRPPTSYTNPLKTKLMNSYGFDPTMRGNYELDHLIALAVGGNPTSVNNLWPEPYDIQENARIKDSFELYLHRQVCDGSISLADAQRELSEDWITSSRNVRDSAGFIASMIPIPNGSFSLGGGDMTDEDDNAQ
jgi:hypothetical protein